MSVRSYLQSRNFNLESVVDFITLPVTDLNGVVVTVTNYSSVFGGNGLKYEYVSAQAKSGHDGYTIISPTVPWDGTLVNLSDYQAGVGETDGAGTGCWVLREALREVSGRVRFEGPTIEEDVVTDAEKSVANGVASLDGSALVPIAELPLATQGEAEAGADNTVLMTPLRVNQALAAQNIPVLLDSQTVSGTPSTLDFANVFAANPGFRYYIVILSGISPSASGDRLSVRISTNGSTFLSTAGGYAYALRNWDPTNASVAGAVVSGSDNMMDIAGDVPTGHTDNGVEVDSTLTFINPAGSSNVLGVDINTAVNSGTNAESYQGYGTYDAATTAVTGFQLLWSGSANFDAGSVFVYGTNLKN